MTTIAPGSGGTISSDIAEGQLFELLNWILLAEADSAKNPQNEESVTAQTNHKSKVFSGSIKLNAIQAIASGQITTTIKETLVSHGFTAATGGTFTSTSPMALLFEIMVFLQSKEADSSANPLGTNNLSYDYAGDTGLITGQFSLPIAIALGNGGISVSAVEYLG